MSLDSMSRISEGLKTLSCAGSMGRYSIYSASGTSVLYNWHELILGVTLYVLMDP